MGQFERTVKELVKQRFGSVAEFARITNLNEQTLYSVFKGNFAHASASTILPIAAALEVDPFDLIQGKLASLPQQPCIFAEVPLFRMLEARQLVENETPKEYFAIHRELYERYSEPFLLSVSDRSMDLVLPNGCYALVEPCSTIEYPGAPYAVSIGASTAIIKRVNPLANGHELVPDSTDPTFKPIILDYGEPDTPKLHIIGRVVWYCLPIEWHLPY